MIKLKQIITQPDTIIFVGSGVSIWSGLPTWSGMIEELACFIEQEGGDSRLVRLEAKKGDLLQAASYGFDMLTKQKIGEFIRLSCRSGKSRPHDIHRKIVSLGPRCFITTNYDDLIEVSLREWQPERFYRAPVTNRHLTEMAEIVHARAMDFIFKPHGDAHDSDSIILTREQYRQLLPQGERQAALESVKLLLASRPVLYLGFGLRDPDFIYVRDLLANTYKGGVRDHYAIMADVHQGEIDYWRRNYGIHLINYDTQERPDKSRDHGALLTLLDELNERDVEPGGQFSFDSTSSDVLLSLARHAAALSRQPKVSPELPIRVSFQKLLSNNAPPGFYHGPVEKFFDSGPDRALLIGHPGAGKTYALRQAVARHAEKLHQICLSEVFDRDKAIIPIIADLKLYRGKLFELVSQTLPETLPLQELIKNLKVKIFLDSFNEMPREFWEGEAYVSDFSDFISRLGQSSLIIGSRTYDGLSGFGLQVYHLDQIEEEAVLKEITQQGISLSGRFSEEMLWLLQRPFFFQYVAAKTISLQSVAHPIDFYKCLLSGISSAFIERFQVDVDIEGLLAVVAYDALNSGEEAFPLTSIIGVIGDGLNDSSALSPGDVVNWFVSKSFLVPYTKGRVGFVHQSITEYLAAAELARRYVSAPRLLKEKLALRRWDQALFLCLSLLSDVQAANFINEVIAIDLSLALNASKYLEHGREEVVSELLDEVIRREGALNRLTQYSMERGLQVTVRHERQLRTLMKFGGSVSGAAAKLLISLKGEGVKREILDLLVSMRTDFNFCSLAASALRDYISEEDVVELVALVDKLDSELDLQDDETIESECGGFLHGAGALLENIEIPVLKRIFVDGAPNGGINKFRFEVISSALCERRSTEALCLAGEILLRGVDKVAVAIYFIAKFSDPEDNVSWECFSSLHAVRLLELLNDQWAFLALQLFCDARQDIAELVRSYASTKEGLQRLIVLSAAGSGAVNELVVELENSIYSVLPEHRESQFELLKAIDWEGQENLILRLLKLRNRTLASAVLGDSILYTQTRTSILHIADVGWWLEWMQEEYVLDENSWLLARLSNFIGINMDANSRAEFILEFNKPDTQFRNVMISMLMSSLDVSTDELSEGAISFVLSSLGRKDRSSRYIDNVLGVFPTERFIVERILPILPNAQGILRARLLQVLEQAGSRHGRRYLVDC